MGDTVYMVAGKERIKIYSPEDGKLLVDGECLFEGVDYEIRKDLGGIFCFKLLYVIEMITEEQENELLASCTVIEPSPLISKEEIENTMLQMEEVKQLVENIRLLSDENEKLKERLSSLSEYCRSIEASVGVSSRDHRQYGSESSEIRAELFIDKIALGERPNATGLTFTSGQILRINEYMGKDDDDYFNTNIANRQKGNH